MQKKFRKENQENQFNLTESEKDRVFSMGEKGEPTQIYPQVSLVK